MQTNPFSSFKTLAKLTDHSVLTGQPIGGYAHVVGATDPPLSHQTIPALLAATVAQHGDRPALVFSASGQRLTWRELDHAVDDLAAGLLSLGVVPGDRVGIWSPNRLEWVLTQFATARIGVILVNINPAYRVSELEYALNKVGVKLLVCAHHFKGTDYLAMLHDLAPELRNGAPGSLQALRLPTLRAVVCLGAEDAVQEGAVLRFTDLVRRVPAAQKGRLNAITGQLHCHEAINIQFTSGTTGTPKGATLTHFNVVNNARYVAQAMRLTADDRLCVPVPLYHCFGMVMGVLVAVSVGATLVFPGEAFEASQTLQTVAAERCTALHGVPTMFIAMLESPDFKRFDLSALRTGIMAGAPCPEETMKQVVRDMHLREITIAYGMTETSPVSFQSATDDPLDKRVSTVGRVQPHLQVKIIDAQGQTVPVGETGELCTQGYSVMKGYWADEGMSQQAVQDGWMHTGDLATLDAQGYCRIVGRVKDMLIRGGENVYPREVEEFLFQHPKISQVQVFGVPDAKYGEEVCAWVQLKPGMQATEDEIKAFCKGQIAHYKIPRYVRLVSEIPMTVTGKAQKFVMREAMVKALGLK